VAAAASMAASARVRRIFQLPAISGVLDMVPLKELLNDY
jgi:hypothetical protein